MNDQHRPDVLSPAAPDSESFVLGVALESSTEHLPAIREALPDAALFHDERHKIVYAAILRLADDAKPPDTVLVVQALRAANRLDAVGGHAFIANLVNSVTSPANLDSNPAKESSTRFASFVERTGATDTYECEALAPADLQTALRDAIESALDHELYDAEVEQEQKDVKEINSFRRKIVEGL